MRPTQSLIMISKKVYQGGSFPPSSNSDNSIQCQSDSRHILSSELTSSTPSRPIFDPSPFQRHSSSVNNMHFDDMSHTGSSTPTHLNLSNDSANYLEVSSNSPELLTFNSNDSCFHEFSSQTKNVLENCTEKLKLIEHNDSIYNNCNINTLSLRTTFVKMKRRTLILRSQNDTGGHCKS